MAGTDSSAAEPEGPRGPVVILVRPQLADNIGATARAMLNCGLTALRLVAPQCKWPSDRGYALAAGADVVLDRATLFPTAIDAVRDLHAVFATTARLRGQVRPVLSPRAAAAELRRREAAGQCTGLLFGPERTGLENDEVALAGAVIQIPLNPAFMSLNLGQAVLLTAYEWFQAGLAPDLVGPESRVLPLAGSAPATQEALHGFFEQLERELMTTNFLTPPEKRPHMQRNLRAPFQRAGLTDQEVRTLRGVVAALAEGRPVRESARRTRRLAARAAQRAEQAQTEQALRGGRRPSRPPGDAT